MYEDNNIYYICLFYLLVEMKFSILIIIIVCKYQPEDKINMPCILKK